MWDWELRQPPMWGFPFQFFQPLRGFQALISAAVISHKYLPRPEGGFSPSCLFWPLKGNLQLPARVGRAICHLTADSGSFSSTPSPTSSAVNAHAFCRFRNLS